MMKVKRWNSSVSRVELDQRVRDARLRLERVERLFVRPVAAKVSWLRRVVCFFGVGKDGIQSRRSRTRGPLSDRRPYAKPQTRPSQLDGCTACHCA